MKNETNKTFFAPQLCIKSGVKDIDFYVRAFGAVELRRWMNDDGTIHVAEFSIDGALFHLHQESPSKGFLDPIQNNGVTAMIGLFVPDVDSVMNKARQAGGMEISPAQDYEYRYRQGEIKDPFGHHWLIESKI